MKSKGISETAHKCRLICTLLVIIKLYAGFFMMLIRLVIGKDALVFKFLTKMIEIRCQPA